MVVLYALIPISHAVGSSQIWIKSGFTLVLLASVYMVSNKLGHALVAVILAALALLGHWFQFIGDYFFPHFTQFFFSIALQTYVTVVMLNHVFRTKIIDRSVLYGAVCIL